LALAQQPAPHHRSLGLAIRHSTDSQLDPAVVEQHPIPRPQGLDELLMADLDLVGFQFQLPTLWGGRAGGAGGGARTSTHEGHDSSPNQPLKRALDPPRPDLRTLEVAQQRNGPARRLRRLPYVGSRLPMGVRVAM